MIGLQDQYFSYMEVFVSEQFLNIKMVLSHKSNIQKWVLFEFGVLDY